MAERLSARMTALADLVTPGVCLADVGTDHGYIPIYLCRVGKIPGAIAMDINRGPLQRAGAHVAECGLEDKIELRLSDGLKLLAPGEADAILIAGMGGALTRRILTDGAAVLEMNPELILQPQSEIGSVRRFLREIGYAIVDEDCVQEDGKFYFPMKARRVEKNGGVLEGNDLEDAFGPVLLKKRHPVLRLYLERELAVVSGISGKLEKQMDVTADSAIPAEGEGALKISKLETRLSEVAAKRKLLETALRIYQ